MRDSNKLVSVIVPAYNVENYIEKSIKSLITQTYNNLEIIVIDDGSSDGTWDRIEALMSKDNRIKGFRLENSGVSNARNYALNKASGDYCMFLDADDSLTEDAVMTLVNEIENNNTDWVNCQYNRLDEEGQLLEEYSFTKGFIDTSDDDKKLSFIRDKLLEYYVGYEVWNKIFRMSVIKDNKLEFIRDCHIGEDLAFNIEYAYYANSISCIENRLYNYLIRSGSAMDNAGALKKSFDESLIIAKGIKNRFEATFNGSIKDKYYQLFTKIMNHASYGFTAPETASVAETCSDRFFYQKMMEYAVKHKSEFNEFYREDLSKLYWRYCYYILTYLEGNVTGKLYFIFYNLYRRLRKRETIDEWRLT